MTRALSTVAVAVLLLTAHRLCLASDKKIPPPTPAQVARPWIGITEDELFLFRLELRLDGTGLGAYVYADQDPQIFQITSWQVKQYAIEMSTTGAGWTRDRDSKLKGRIMGGKLELTILSRQRRPFTLSLGRRPRIREIKKRSALKA